MTASKTLADWIAANGGTGVNFGKTSYIARITGEHAKYNLDREFLSYKKSTSYSGKTGTKAVDAADVEVGGVYEIRCDSWGNRHQYFVVVTRKDVTDDGVELSTERIRGGDDEVLAYVRGEKQAYPSPRDVPEGLESAVGVVCEHCGDAFASRRGVSIHQSLVDCGVETDVESDESDKSDESDESDDRVENQPPASTSEAGATDDADGAAIATDGGQTQVKSRGEAKVDGSLIREYRADGRLYAYRSDDGDEHVVVSRGDEPATRWTERIPATVERPVPGQQRWTIPDNWDQRVKSSRDSIAYGLFYVPESDVWVQMSIPTNNWLGDSWYGVQAVGDLDVEPSGDLGTALDVYELADLTEDDGYEADAEAFRAVARSWDDVETELDMATEWVRDEGIDELRVADQPLPADENWEIEFHDDYIFRPGEHIDVDDYDIPEAVVLDELRDADLLPSHYRFRLRIDESAVDSEYYLRGLVEAGCTPPEALDYLMTEVRNLSKAEWARERGVKRPSVSGNVSRASDKLTA